MNADRAFTFTNTMVITFWLSALSRNRPIKRYCSECTFWHGKSTFACKFLTRVSNPDLTEPEKPGFYTFFWNPKKKDSKNDSVKIRQNWVFFWKRVTLARQYLIFSETSELLKFGILFHVGKQFESACCEVWMPIFYPGKLYFRDVFMFLWIFL